MWYVRIDNADLKKRTIMPQCNFSSAQSLRAIVHSLRVSHDRQIAARFSGVEAKSVSERAKETNIKEAAYATMRAQYNDFFYRAISEGGKYDLHIRATSEQGTVKIEPYDIPLEDVLGITSFPEDGAVSLTAAQAQHVNPVLCGYKSTAEASAATDHTPATMVEDCRHHQRLIWHLLHGIDPDPQYIIVTACRQATFLLSAFKAVGADRSAGFGKKDGTVTTASAGVDRLSLRAVTTFLRGTTKHGPAQATEGLAGT